VLGGTVISCFLFFQAVVKNCWTHGPHTKYLMNRHVLLESKHTFYNIAHFPNVLGTHCCIHVQIVSPSANECIYSSRFQAFIWEIVEMIVEPPLVCTAPSPSCQDPYPFTSVLSDTQFEVSVMCWKRVIHRWASELREDKNYNNFGTHSSSSSMAVAIDNMYIFSVV